MKPITTPINRALRGILSDHLKPVQRVCVCAHEGHRATVISWESVGEKSFFFLLAVDYFPPMIKTLARSFI